MRRSNGLCAGKIGACSIHDPAAALELSVGGIPGKALFSLLGLIVYEGLYLADLALGEDPNRGGFWTGMAPFTIQYKKCRICCIS